MFGTSCGYKKTDEWEKVWKEPSATIVWGTLKSARSLPLVWASYPYHPHIDRSPLSNRAPTNLELEIGRPFILDLVKIFGIKNVVAVGNKAEITLGKSGIKGPKIRHPSHGGAKLFAQGITQYIK
ncbi:MAG: uracil-DNA glycosylase [Patescibacteria group bacterium]